VLEGGLGLVSLIYISHEIVSVDIDEYSYKAEDNSNDLAPVNSYPIEVVIDDEDKERSSNTDGVDKGEGEDEVHACVNHLIYNDE
jgi:hypothetical protein